MMARGSWPCSQEPSDNEHKAGKGSFSGPPPKPSKALPMRNWKLWEHPEIPPKRALGRLQQVTSQAVDSIRWEERGGVGTPTLQLTDWLWGHSSEALAIPEITREYLEGANAVSQALEGWCQQKLYFQAGDIWVARGQDRGGYRFPYTGSGLRSFSEQVTPPVRRLPGTPKFYFSVRL